MRLNNKGAIDMMFVVLLVVLLGFGGFVFWRISSTSDEVAKTGEATENASRIVPSANDDDEPTEDAEEESNEKQVTIGNDWEAEDSENTQGLSDNLTAAYVQQDGNAKMYLYSDNPEVYYSANAPVKCQYEDGQWTHYTLSDATREYEVTDTTNCNELAVTSTIEGVDIVSFPGGALGQYRYISVFAIADEWYAVQDFSVVPIENDDQELITATQDRVASLVADLIN